MPKKRREALSKYFLDVSKIVLGVGVLTPLLAPEIVGLAKTVLSLIVGITLVIIEYNLQPKE